MARSLSRLLVGLALTALLGCGSSDMEDLQAFVDEKKQRPGGLIEPIPTFSAYEAFAYSAASLRSPFDRPIEVVELTQLRLRSSIEPDRSRTREFLEQLPLESLELVGRLQRDGVLWALLRGPTGRVYRVTEGNYVGEDHGKVVEIGDSYVAIVEIVSDGTSDGWVERPRTIDLASE